MKPYYQDNHCTIYHGDCLELMKNIPDGSIDLILADPPYGTTQNKWDIVIPLDKMWKQLNRVVKFNGAIVLTSQSLFTARIITTSPTYRYSLVWEKTKAGGFLNARRMPMQAHEDVTVHYGRLPTYNPQMEKGVPFTNKAVSNGDGGNYGSFSRVGKVVTNCGERFPRSVLKFQNSNHKSKHPTQKPVALMEYFIKTYSNEGDTVLDFAMGSGTTGVSCKNTHRNFIGIELDEKYCEIAARRLGNEVVEAIEKSTRCICCGSEDTINAHEGSRYCNDCEEHFMPGGGLL